MEKRSNLVKSRAAQIVLSLLSEGYHLVFRSECYSVYKLQHINGNHITVQCGQLGVSVFKNGNLKKLEIV